MDERQDFRQGHDPHKQPDDWPWEVGRPVACTHALSDPCAAMFERRMEAARRLRDEVRLVIGAH